MTSRIEDAMGAVADFYIECVENDCLPLSDDTWKYLFRDDISELTDDFSEIGEFHFTSRFGETHLIEGISVNFARHLDRLGLAVTEIKDLLEMIDCNREWANKVKCAECGDLVTFSPNGWGESFCTECY